MSKAFDPAGQETPQVVQGVVLAVGAATVQVRGIGENCQVASPLTIDHIKLGDIVAVNYINGRPYVTAILGHQTAKRHDPYEDTEPPSPPTNLRVVQGQYGSVLKWDYIPITHSKIGYDLAYFEVDARTPGGAWGYDVYPVSVGTARYHAALHKGPVQPRVRAVDLRGNESVWVVCEDLLADTVAPPAPTGFAIDPILDGVRASWTGPTLQTCSDLAGFVLYGAEDDTGANALELGRAGASALEYAYVPKYYLYRWYNLTAIDTAGNESDYASETWLAAQPNPPIEGQLLTNADWENPNSYGTWPQDWSSSDNLYDILTYQSTGGLGNGRCIRLNFSATVPDYPYSEYIYWPVLTEDVDVAGIVDGMYTVSVYVKPSYMSMDTILEDGWLSFQLAAHDGSSVTAAMGVTRLTYGYEKIDLGWYRYWETMVWKETVGYDYLALYINVYLPESPSLGPEYVDIDRPQLQYGPTITEFGLSNVREGMSTNLHASTHITSGSDEVDGDKLDIDWDPSTYTPSTTPSEADSLDNLTAHLYGIDQALSGLAPGAIADEQFVVLSLTGDLANERVLTAGDGIDVTDGGAGSTVTVAVDVTDILGSGLTESSNNIDLAWGTPTIGTIQCDATANAGTSTNPARSDHQHAIVCAAPTTNLSSSSTNAEGSANSFARSDHTHAVDGLATNITDEQYLVLSYSADLSAERLFTPGDGLDGTDGGAGSTYTLAVDVTDVIDTNYGLTESSNNIRVNLASPSGLEFSSGALRINDTIAGNGLTISSKVLAVGAGDGIDVSADAIAVDVTDIIGTGLSESSNDIVLPTPGTLTVSTSNAAAAPHTHAITSSDSPGAAASILASSSAGKLTLVDLALTSLTASTVVYSDASKEITSLANSTGYLYNNGSGTLSWSTTPGPNLSAEPLVTVSASGNLSAERVLTAGDGIDVTDGGANSTITVAVDVTDILGSGLTESSNNVALDWGTPTIGTIECDDSASAGSSTNPARSDHQHAIVCAAPTANLNADSTNSEGSASSFARSDHSHGIGVSAPNFTFSTSNAEGTLLNFIRRDATIALFDATVPATLTVSTSAATGSAGKAARRDHAHDITTSSNPGAAASILASSAAGKLTLVDLALTSLTASTVIYSDASKEITSLANGTGFLYNNGSGTLSYNNAPFSWVMEAAYPTAISANTNDYNPGTGATLLCLTCSGGSYNITGLTGGTEGMFRYIFNTDATYALTLTHADTNSLAANRFLNVEATDTVLGPYDAATYVYISSRWRQLAWA